MEATVAQKLEVLLQLQELDSQLDGITKIRGDLPEEVRDLEDEIAGFETRISKFQKDLDAIDEDIAKHKNAKKESEKMIAKYKEQQMNVRNNREFEAIAKEIELQQLEMELSDKRINELNYRVASKQEEIKDTKGNMDERKKDLDAKKKELSVIVAESQDEEKAIMTKRTKQSEKVDTLLFRAYEKIRNNSRNGLAIVTVRRGACGGCFNVVPPQRQADIREKKKIIVCEHCGRILADVEDVPVVTSGRGR